MTSARVSPVWVSRTFRVLVALVFMACSLVCNFPSPISIHQSVSTSNVVQTDSPEFSRVSAHKRGGRALTPGVAWCTLGRGNSGQGGAGREPECGGGKGNGRPTSTAAPGEGILTI